jgi:hypothetical protein
MWSAKAYGPQVFQDVFSVDRPLRAYVMIPAYILFGENPLWYNLSAWFWRVLSGVAFWAVVRNVWPKIAYGGLVGAILVVLYPGFLSQYNGIDYQSQMVSLALAMFSILLTVLALGESKLVKKFFLIAISIGLGWAYLGLVEYEVGFEGLRLALIAVVVSRSRMRLKLFFVETIKNWLPYSLVVLGFIGWRALFFEGGRAATDAGLQLSRLLLSPGRTLLSWGSQLAQDAIDVFVLAWFEPLRIVFPYLSGAWWLPLVAAGMLLAFWAGKQLKSELNHDHSNRNELLFCGLFGGVIGLIPVILANREVAFPDFSRYSLVSSFGVALFITGLMLYFNNRWRSVLLSLLVGIALFTHSGNTSRFLAETAAMRDYWWQVAWRAPNLTEMTTIVAEYPVATLQEDYFIWGPANLIYYPYGFHEKDIQPALFAALPTQETFEQILSREPQQYYKRRNIVTYANYRNVLVILKPTPESCIRVLGPELADISRHDAEIILDVRRYSEMERILLDNPRTPPSIIFGNEPEHDWCYYYQKASLARQYGDWAKVRALGYEIREKKLAPNDDIEWLPFLQAEAVVEASDFLFEINSRMTDPFSRQQACFSLEELDVPEKNSALFCDSQ